MTSAAMRTASDVREGGEWSLAQRTKNDAIHFLATLALALARRSSREGLVRFGRSLGWLVHAVAWPLRTIARDNLAIGMPHADAATRRAIAREAFVNLAGHLAEAISFLHASIEPLPFDQASRDVLALALDEGRGVVLPSAHLGPWERLAATLVSAGFPLTAIVRESYDPRFDRVVGAARARAGVATIARGSRAAPTRIVRVLRANAVLGIPMDLRTRAESVVVPLLNGRAPTPVGPARLALRIGAPVVVCTVEPRAGILTVTCTRLSTRDLGRGDDIELSARINAELSRRILLAPGEWPWMHSRFV